MQLSLEKCKVMHLGKQTNPEDYFIAGKMNGVKECERFRCSRLMTRGTKE